MRVVLQLVKNASVDVGGERVAEIGKGFLLFAAFTPGDDEAVAKKMAEKICKLRIFPDETGKTNRSLDDVGGRILSVSQFTLYASVKEGNRPSFTNSMRKEEATVLYDTFVDALKKIRPDTISGIFHADMDVGLHNDGPFTLILDSKELFA